MRSIVLSLVILALPAFAAETPQRPLVIAHRGASGYLPEHTIEAYALAIDQGADFIEPDFVATKDGYLIARHENELSETTDVAQRYPDRKRTKVIDGKTVEGWFSEDFTLDEIGYLHAKERVPFRSHANDGKFRIPSIADILVLRAQKTRETGRRIGVYPETKHPAYFRSIGLPLEPHLHEVLKAWALDRPGSPIFVQSFEPDSLKTLAKLMPAVPRVQLLGPEPVTDAQLKEIAIYAQGIGPAKNMIVPVNKEGHTSPPTDIVTHAHKAGLVVHPYTFRPEAQFLPVTYGGDALAEFCQFAKLGVDAVFTDTPDLALKAFRESCPMSLRPERK